MLTIVKYLVIHNAKREVWLCGKDMSVYCNVVVFFNSYELLEYMPGCVERIWLYVDIV